MPDYDLVIKAGTVIDGTGAARFDADVAVAGGRIVALGSIDESRAAHVIDAAGLVVAPGVIDPHTHFDSQVHWDPYCTSGSWHGVTTVVTTNCGFGFAPCAPADRDRAMRMMESTEQVPYEVQRRALGWDWETFPEWMDHLARTPKGINLACYLPLNPLLIHVMGVEDAKTRRATPAEMSRMKKILEDAMNCGAVGFSFSYLGAAANSHTDFDGTPMPSDVHDPEDFIELGKVLGDRGDGLIQTTISLPGADFRDVAAAIARASGRPVLHNILGPFDSAPGYSKDMLAWLDACSDEGLQVYGQAGARGWLEFTLEHFTNWERFKYLVPFSKAPVAEKITMAADPAFVAGARDAYEGAHGVGGRWEDYILTHANGAEEYQRFEGRNLEAIARELNNDIVTTIFDILAKSSMRADFVQPIAMCDTPELWREALAHPRVLPGISDGGAHVKYFSVAFSADMLGWIVRELGLFTLEEMHVKLSALPAKVFGFSDRGTLTERMAADIMVYDPDVIDYASRYRYEKVHDLPDGSWRRAAPAKGVRAVIVNGETIFDNGVSSGALPGRVIRPGS